MPMKRDPAEMQSRAAERIGSDRAVWQRVVVDAVTLILKGQDAVTLDELIHCVSLGLVLDDTRRDLSDEIRQVASRAAIAHLEKVRAKKL